MIIDSFAIILFSVFLRVWSFKMLPVYAAGQALLEKKMFFDK
jgi:hypothetical protein